MPIDLAKAVGGGGGPALGECIYMPDASTPIVSISGQEFLMSGYRLVDEAASYPEVFGAFAGPDLGQPLITSLPASGNWSGAAYGAGKFVCVSAISSGSGHYGAVSSDGINWTLSNLSTGVSWAAVRYVNGIFVAVGSGQSVTTSPDGINWTVRSLPQSTSWNTCDGGNGMFLITSSTAMSATSPNGITWTYRALPISVTRSVFGDGKFVALGDNAAITSTDGITWSAPTALPTAGTWVALEYGNGLFVAVSNTNQVMTSPDGITWAAFTVSTNNGFRLAFGDGLFVLTTLNATSVMTSTDGRTWTPRIAPISVGGAVAVGNGMCVMSGHSTPRAAVLPVTQGVGIPEYKTDGPTTLYMRIK